MEEKKIWLVVTTDVLDGSDYVRVEAFSNKEDALTVFNNKVQSTRTEWTANLGEDGFAEEVGENNVSFYEDGIYSLSHYNIELVETILK